MDHVTTFGLTQNDHKKTSINHCYILSFYHHLLFVYKKDGKGTHLSKLIN
jgi:hypothetical protein